MTIIDISVIFLTHKIKKEASQIKSDYLYLKQTSNRKSHREDVNWKTLCGRCSVQIFIY